MPLSTAELFKKAKKIEIASRRLVDEQLAGQYHAVFKGRGLIFSDVRQYYPGDFNFDSYRLGRVQVLSARPQDSAQLEEFLRLEFFGKPR